MQFCNYKLRPVVAIVAAMFVNSAFAQADGVVKTDDVSVFGQGQSRQVQSINSDDMEKAVAGTSPLKVLAKLPGVSFQSADPFGAYEWSTRFSVRGFGQSYMGFTLDGVPLGDMSYGNNNGLHISRAISSENIGRANLSQGSGALGVASTSNLGGTVQFFSAEPDNKFGVRLDQTIGSSNMTRTFVKVDTGLLDSGTKAYFSYDHQDADKWKGAGPQTQDQFNSKIVHMWGESRVSAFLNTSDRTEIDYQDMSKDMQAKLGWGWDNYAPNWNRAVDAANGVYTGNVGSINPGTGPKDAAYYQGSGLRKDALMGSSMDLALTDDLRLKATVYHHTDSGQGHWYTPYVASPGTPAGPGVYTGTGLPISIRTTEYSINRSGVLSDITWTSGINTLNAGAWFEKSNSTTSRNYYAATGGNDTNYFLSNPFRTDFNQTFETTTTQLHVQDTLALMDGKLKVNAGFKSPKVEINATKTPGSARSAGSLTAEKSFLPQVGVNYIFNESNEVFASASQNMRAYQPGVNGPFSQSQTAFDAGLPNLKPETSNTYEVGYRFKADKLQGSLAAYLSDFNNRLLQISSTGIVSIPGVFVNVGQVQSKGIEAALAWSPIENWTWFNSLTLNDSKYKSDYTTGGVVVNTNGKQVVDAPKLMFNTDVGYESNGWFGNIGAKYTGQRYYTYLNDNSVNGFWDTNASAGYKKKDVAGLREVSAQITITNLLDDKHFSTIGSNGFTASDPQGAYATMLEGAPRQVFVTVSGKF